MCQDRCDGVCIVLKIEYEMFVIDVRSSMFRLWLISCDTLLMYPFVDIQTLLLLEDLSLRILIFSLANNDSSLLFFFSCFVDGWWRDWGSVVVILITSSPPSCSWVSSSSSVLSSKEADRAYARRFFLCTSVPFSSFSLRFYQRLKVITVYVWGEE